MKREFVIQLMNLEEKVKGKEARADAVLRHSQAPQGERSGLTCALYCEWDRFEMVFVD